MKNARLIDTAKSKVFASETYNFIFDKTTGFFARWGKTQEDDPTYSPFGPELVDIEISTICSGVEGIGPCKFCYKSNTAKGNYMSLDTFKKVFHNLPKTVTQIAFGIGDIEGNPDMWPIFDYCRENGVIPNVTVNGEGITDAIADRLASTCGAVAVSIYDENKSYNTVKMLTDRGMKQVNVHFMICEETYERAKHLMYDRVNDPRLEKLNAIVFLRMKPKGRASRGHFTPITEEHFKYLVDRAFEMNIGIGFDSCGAGKFIDVIRGTENEAKYMQMVEPCESTKFSMYINDQGQYFPCSFIEGEVVENGGDWTSGLDVVNSTNFYKDIWMNEKTVAFREKCIECTSRNGNCPHYRI